MLKYYFFIITCTFSFYVFSQSVKIAEQNFDESNPVWNFSTDTPFFDNGIDGFFGIHDGDNNNDSNDTGIAVKSDAITFQNIANDFLFINDLNDEGNNGTNGEATLSFDSISIGSYQNVSISFDYEIIAFDSPDYILYEIIEDGISTKLDTVPNNELGSALIAIKNKTQNLILKFIIKQNGQSDFAAIDNIELQGIPIEPCTELLISEYVEGTSSTNYRNNFIEIYNPTSSDIDLENYDLVKYTGANLNISSTLNLSGTIPSLGTFVIEDQNEILGINANLSTSSAVMDFTGNSKIALRNLSSIIDLIGVIGEDKNFAKDITLRRKSKVQNPNSQYDVEEWDVYGLEDTSNINSHVSYCNGAIPEMEIRGNTIEIIDGTLVSSTSNNTYFGNIDPFTGNSISKSFTIKNTGSAVLEISKVEIIGANANQFTIQGEAVFTINPDESTNFQINFTPSSLGIKTATINIINTDASENPYNFVIQGEGSGQSNSPIMISQYYEGSANNKWLEITNVSNAIIPKNTYYLALYWNDDANNTVGRKPSRSKIIPVLMPGETLKYRSTLNVTQPSYALNDNEIKSSVCSFTGDDIIILSRTNDETCWANKVDIIGNNSNWGSNISFIRKYGCESVGPNTGFDSNDWFIIEISEVNSSPPGLSARIGEHFLGSTFFDNNNSWNNGIPDLNRNAAINSDYDTAIHGNFESCNLTIGKNSILTISSNNFVSIKNDLTINGVLDVEHEGSLLMINNNGLVTNSGTTHIHKTTTTIKKFDFTYWSSPVNNAILENVFISSPQNSFFNFNTPSFNDFDNNGIDDENNDWQRATGLMEIGKGYTAMAPNTNPFIDSQSVSFDGQINNGIIQVPVSLSGDDLNDFDDWNLIGNPYPSAIDVELLLNNTNNQNLLNGTIYLWTHNTPSFSDAEGQKYSSNDYAMYNVGTGGIAAVSQGVIPTKYIASSQGFFVEAIQSGNVEFSNSMRTKSNNNNFFKERKLKPQKENEGKIWINLFNEKGGFSQLLIGFIDGASSLYESKYDGLRLEGGNYLSFYSVANEQNLAIQGTGLFSPESTFDLGYASKITDQTDLKIAIDHVEGILQKQDIYLYDKKLNKTHNLKLSDYSFESNTPGTFNHRFILKFNKESIDLPDEKLVKEILILQNEADQLLVRTSLNGLISSITIYDLLGRRINHVKSNSSKVLVDSSILKRGNIFIIRVKLSNSRVFIKKFIR